MAKKKENPHGYIYLATNLINGKEYIGKTKVERWKPKQDPIKMRWAEEVSIAYNKKGTGKYFRAIENAINKYGEENFELKELDVAHSKEELNAKEKQFIKEKDSMIPKGYNMTEGGDGGSPSPEVKERISQKVSDKWQEKEYSEKQIKERRERGKDPEWKAKMTEINRERAKIPAYQEKMSKALKEKFQEKEYQEKRAKISEKMSKDPKFREKMTEINRDRAKEIGNKQEFLRDIQEMKKKDLNSKYGMDGKTINRRIKEMLGDYRVKNYSEAREYLKDKKIEAVVKEIEKKSKKDNISEKQKSGLDGEKTEKSKDVKKEGDKKEEKKESKDDHKEESDSKPQKTSDDKTSEENREESKAKESDKDKEVSKPDNENSNNNDSKTAEHTPKEDIESKISESEKKDKNISKNQESELPRNDKELNDTRKDYNGINETQRKNEKDYQKIKDNLGQNKKDFECLRDNSKNVSDKDKKGNQREIPTDKEFGGKTAEEKAALSKQKEQKKDYDKIKENRFDSKKDYDGIKESSRKERKDYDKIKEESE